MRSEQTPVSLRLDPALHAEVAALAAAFDRSKAWVIEQAVREYLANQAWQLAAIREGLAAAEAGQTAAHADVAAWVAGWGTEDERPAP
jgi:predicted transcriptional regulator